VAGKVFIEPNHRAALDDGITWALWQVATPPQQAALSEALRDFKDAEKSAGLVTDEEYVQAKRNLQSLAVSVLGINPNLAIAHILPLELTLDGMDSFTESNKEIVEEAMPLYTIHNRSVLTDTIFLGFPFHYFYTAVFLLIVFIGICWIYCYKIDKYNKKIELSE
jgi:putative solute:sodium symporter small subunit